jgi:tRNA pseudouridine38-40 synthase
MTAAHGKQKTLPASFRLTLEYDGSRYQGWQRQGSGQSAAGVKTIAGTLDRVLHRAGVKILNLTGSGRTDSGVHALGQVASLHVARPIKSSELYRILEQGLPHDIAVTGLEPCRSDFNARHDAISRTYLYQIALRKGAFAKNYTWWPKLPLDLRLTEEAWLLFEGNHSMAAFADLETGEDPHSRIYKCRAKTEGNTLSLRVTARFFLRKQVRRMVGAVVHCAIGRTGIEQIRGDLESPSREAALFWAERAAPAAGLFLEAVDYSNSTTKF